MQSQEKFTNTDYGVFHVFLRAFSLSKPYWLAGLGLCLALLVSVLITVALPLIYQEMFDKAIPAGDRAYLTNLFLVMVAAFLVMMSMDTTWGFLVARLTSHLLRDLRARMFQHLQYLSLQYFSRVSTGDTISRFSNDLNAVENFLLLGIPRTILGFLLFLLSTFLLFVIEWRLALITLMTLPLTALASIIWGEKAKKASYFRKQNEAEITNRLEEIITLQPVIRAFSLQKTLTCKFTSLLEILQKSSFRLSLFTSFIENLTVGGVHLSVMIVIGGGAILAMDGIVSLGVLIGFFSVLLNIVTGITLISTALPEVFKATGALRRIDELLQESSQVFDPKDVKPLKPLADQICFKDVSFGYTPDKLSLDRINFSLHNGQAVAFVGSSGSGKSTILKLILRFYDPDKGAVTWDKQNLKDIAQDSLRNNLSVVFQDTALFDTTIKENIRLGKLDAKAEEIVAAAKAAEIHDFIVQLPDGYDTPVGEHGSKLSGGQRQRIAIARAILRHPAILILDEATAALDVETEASINATLNSLRKGRNVLCVTHRLALIENFDVIYVLHEGKIVESGTHAELIANKNMYYNLIQKQSGFVVNEDTYQVKVKPSYLKAIPLLSSLQNDILDDLTQYFKSERISGKEIIFEQGDIGEKFYLIAHGNVEVVVEEKVIAKLGIGDYFGEIALIKSVPRIATIRTVAPCLLLSISKGNFQRLLTKSPELLKEIEIEAEKRLFETLS